MAKNNQTPTNRKISLEREWGELNDAKALVENPSFQKYFAAPLHKLNSELKNNYECATLAELKLIQGKHWGLQQFFKCVDEIESKLKFVKNDLDKI